MITCLINLLYRILPQAVQDGCNLQLRKALSLIPYLNLEGQIVYREDLEGRPVI